MIITKRHKIKHLYAIEPILNCSNQKLEDEIMKFDSPKKIGLMTVKKESKISIGQMLKIWDIKDGHDLIQQTVDTMLLNTKFNRLYYKLFIRKYTNLPLIDFTRLTKEVELIAKKASDAFKTLERQPKDLKKKAIYEKYKGDKFDFIARFCEIAPAYTYDEAFDVSWVTVFQAFRRQTKQDDINEEIQEVMK